MANGAHRQCRSVHCTRLIRCCQRQRRLSIGTALAWLNCWRGGKGASPRPVSLGRSSVHPGACGNHGTCPFVASLRLTLTFMLVVDSSTPTTG